MSKQPTLKEQIKNLKSLNLELTKVNLKANNEIKALREVAEKVERLQTHNEELLDKVGNKNFTIQKLQGEVEQAKDHSASMESELRVRKGVMEESLNIIKHCIRSMGMPDDTHAIHEMKERARMDNVRDFACSIVGEENLNEFMFLFSMLIVLDRRIPICDVESVQDIYFRRNNIGRN